MLDEYQASVVQPFVTLEKIFNATVSDESQTGYPASNDSATGFLVCRHSKNFNNEPQEGNIETVWPRIWEARKPLGFFRPYDSH